MSMSIIFDTHKYIKEAEKAGYSSTQAEFSADQMVRLIDNTLATKQDLLNLKNELIIKLGTLMGIYSGIIIGVVAYIGHK